MLTLWSVLCRRCPLLPSSELLYRSRLCAAGAIQCADRGREINLLPLQLLAHPGINGKLSCWSRVVWRRVTSRNGWRSCLTKSQAIPLATGCVRKTPSGRIPAWKWLPKAC
ncbi:hypothetical protein ACNKHT_00970 [Shigella flexneri]